MIEHITWICVVLPDVNCHLLPLLHKDICVLRLGGVFPMLLRQVEGHGDVTRRLLFGLHAAGHWGRHGHAGLWKLAEKTSKKGWRRLGLFFSSPVAFSETTRPCVSGSLISGVWRLSRRSACAGRLNGISLFCHVSSLRRKQLSKRRSRPATSKCWAHDKVCLHRTAFLPLPSLHSCGFPGQMRSDCTGINFWLMWQDLKILTPT